MPHSKTARNILVVVSFFGLLPLSARLGYDFLFTHPFRTGLEYQYPILMVWPDHIELRWFQDVSEISPRPENAGYTFSVSPEREAWVKAQVRDTRQLAAPDAGWIIYVKPLGPSRQRIQLELMGDNISGIIYEVRGNEVVPLKSRFAGPLDSLPILLVHILVWSGMWFLVWLGMRATAMIRRTQ